MMSASATMRSAAFLLALVGVLGLGACAAPRVVQPSRTTVVLLPDEDGNVGTVLVANGAGSQRIDQAYQATTVVGTRRQPSDATLLGRASVSANYGSLLQAQPPKPKRFIVHFLLDKAILTDASKAMIPAVLAAIRERQPTEITVFGHADASGKEKRNVRLSADRARVIATMLRKTDPTPGRIDIQFFGDRAPLFPSDSRRPDPRNRRVEIMVL